MHRNSILKVNLLCPAKVNLALSVGSPHNDGMHPIASWMVAIGLGDSLTLEKVDGRSSQYDIGFDTADPNTANPRFSVDWPLEQDLAYRAHRLIERHINRRLTIRLTLRKRVPPGAGLGGGSSNAAGVLTGLNPLFGLGIDLEILINLGLGLGSDVGFLVGAMSGQPSALVTGLGEALEPISINNTLYLVLIFPCFGCPTADVYRTLDEQRRGEAAVEIDPGLVRALANTPSRVAEGLFNDLAQPACTVQPQLKDLQTRLADKLGLPMHITGSGSTLFFIAPDADTCQDLAKEAGAITGLPTAATQTI